MATSAKWGVLAFLRWRPASYGYWIASEFEQAFPGWEITPQALYAALDRLEKAALIVPLERVEVSAGCNRTPYRLTEEGDRELDGFLSRVDRDLLSVPREYFVLAVRIAAWKGLDVVLALFDDLERRVGERLDRHKRARPPEGLTEQAYGDWLFSKFDQHDLYARLAWIQDAREAAVEIAGGGAQR